jgi:hypothetical protein
MAKRETSELARGIAVVDEWYRDGGGSPEELIIVLDQNGLMRFDKHAWDAQRMRWWDRQYRLHVLQRKQPEREPSSLPLLDPDTGKIINMKKAVGDWEPDRGVELLEQEFRRYKTGEKRFKRIAKVVFNASGRKKIANQLTFNFVDYPHLDPAAGVKETA